MAFSTTQIFLMAAAAAAAAVLLLVIATQQNDDEGPDPTGLYKLRRTLLKATPEKYQKRPSFVDFMSKWDKYMHAEQQCVLVTDATNLDTAVRTYCKSPGSDILIPFANGAEINKDRLNYLREDQKPPDSVMRASSEFILDSNNCSQNIGDPVEPNVCAKLLDYERPSPFDVLQCIGAPTNVYDDSSGNMMTCTAEDETVCETLVERKLDEVFSTYPMFNENVMDSLAMVKMLPTSIAPMYECTANAVNEYMFKMHKLNYAFPSG